MTDLPESSSPPPLPAEPPLVTEAGTAPAPAPESFKFHGDAREYFRIWIVNTLLTILTAGLFSAWAKVRKRRYLRGNIELMGHRFDYRADPRRILVGNIGVAILFLAYMVVGEVYPAIRIGAVVLGAILLPWVVIRSLAFNAYNTSYRGMRFYFSQTYGLTALTYIGQFVVVLVSLGFYYPAWMRNLRAFAIGNHRLGDAFFRFDGRNGPFYSAYFAGGAMVFGAAMLGGVTVAGLLAFSGHKVAGLLEMLPFFAIYGFVFYLAKHYIYAQLFNHVWNHTRLDEHRFAAKLEVDRWLKLQLVNLGAMIVTGGLLYPWAAMRSSAYALSCLKFVPAGPIDTISRLGKDEGSAFGESAGEFIGMDFGL